ncbi:MAG: sulfite exporter TauE/SafE family protein [Clostridium sp.]|uniref:sulfite exporter TauE/SafE family protein n=1 Tax=Clostridium sp. TaxID=1506 RepID=UPI0039EA3DE6
MKKNKSRILALATGAPIGFLCGLIGLGGAEFRIPVLLGKFKFSVHKAVSMNLAVSLVTVMSSVLFRLPKVNVNDIWPLRILILMFIIGSMAGAYFGGYFSKKITEETLKTTMLIVLIFIGVLLVFEGFHPIGSAKLTYEFTVKSSILCIALGSIIGTISSLLGVAGGEITIPTLMLVFGIDIKIAGTVSLLINIPALIVGISKHALNGAYSSKKDIVDLVLPMGIGSIIGSFLGSYIIAYISGSFIKVLLGALLITSVMKVFIKDRQSVNYSPLIEGELPASKSS